MKISSLISLAQYKNVTMQRTTIAAQYRGLMQSQPRHVYVLPAPNTFLEFHGVIFVAQSFYAKGVFTFKIKLPDECVHARCTAAPPAAALLAAVTLPTRAHMLSAHCVDSYRTSAAAIQ